MSPPVSRLRTWLQLFRAPNLFTVPGDPLAGYLLTSFGAFQSAAFYAVAASLCLYAAGLLDNDLADQAEDRAERPDRPLPSGAASPWAVRTVAILLVAAGLAFAAAAGGAALQVAIVLTLLIVLYNHRTKRIAGIGALNMGACRGLSVLLGAAAAPHGELTMPLLVRGMLDPLLIALLLVTLYIAAITHLARFETKESAPPEAKWLPMAALLFGMIAFLRLLPQPIEPEEAAGLLERFAATPFWTVLLLFTIAFLANIQISWRITFEPGAPLPPAIGQFIRILLLLQAALCAGVSTIVSSVAVTFLLILWPLSRMASRKFYAS